MVNERLDCEGCYWKDECRDGCENEEACDYYTPISMTDEYIDALIEKNRREFMKQFYRRFFDERSDEYIF